LAKTKGICHLRSVGLQPTATIGKPLPGLFGDRAIDIISQFTFHSQFSPLTSQRPALNSQYRTSSFPLRTFSTYHFFRYLFFSQRHRDTGEKFMEKKQYSYFVLPTSYFFQPLLTIIPPCLNIPSNSDNKPYQK
jgi:hypothetical protein